LDVLTVVQLEDLDGKGGALEAEALHAFEDSGGPLGSPETEGLGAALKGHGSDQTDHTEQVIGVHVCKEDVLERERDPVSHHLTLSAFAAVEHQRLAFAVEREEATLRSTVGRDADVPRRCTVSDMVGEYSREVELFLLEQSLLCGFSRGR
jgi:hypothetical protein